MSIETNKAVVRRYYEEVLNGGNVDALGEIAVAQYVEHDPLPGQAEGIEGLRQRVEVIQSAFRQRFVLDDLVAEDDKVVVRWTGHGSHVGEFLGMPATGKSFTIAGIDIHRLRGGRMAEHWHVIDQLSQLQQLGFLPQPAESSA